MSFQSFSHPTHAGTLIQIRKEGSGLLPCRHTLNDEPISPNGRLATYSILAKGYKEAGISPLAYCFHLPRTDRPGWRVTTADAPFQVEKYDEQRSGG